VYGAANKKHLQQRTQLPVKMAHVCAYHCEQTRYTIQHREPLLTHWPSMLLLMKN